VDIRFSDIIGDQKFNIGHVTPTTPLLWVNCQPLLGLDMAYLCTEFDHSSFISFQRYTPVYQSANEM